MELTDDEIHMKNINEYILELRNRSNKLYDESKFCYDHNFRLEGESIKAKADIITNIILELKDIFDLD